MSIWTWSPYLSCTHPLSLYPRHTEMMKHSFQEKEPKIQLLEVRDWRTSKYPLRLIIRGIFLTYMYSGFWQVLIHPPYAKLVPDPDKPDAKGFEYLTLCGFVATTISILLSSANEFFPRMKSYKVGLNGIILVIEAMITLLYWTLYFIAPDMIHDPDAAEANGGPPPVFMDTAAHLIPFLAMLSDFMMTRSSKKQLYEHRVYHIVAIAAFTFGYFIWIVYLFNKSEKFPYPFLREMNPAIRIAFTVVNTFMGLFIYGVICRAYFMFHATEDDLPVLEQQLYDDEEE